MTVRRRRSSIASPEEVLTEISCAFEEGTTGQLALSLLAQGQTLLKQRLSEFERHRMTEVDQLSRTFVEPSLDGRELGPLLSEPVAARFPALFNALQRLRANLLRARRLHWEKGAPLRQQLSALEEELIRRGWCALKEAHGAGPGSHVTLASGGGLVLEHISVRMGSDETLNVQFEGPAIRSKGMLGKLRRTAPLWDITGLVVSKPTTRAKATSSGVAANDGNEAPSSSAAGTVLRPSHRGARA